MFKTTWFLGLVQGIGNVVEMTRREVLEGDSEGANYDNERVMAKLKIRLEDNRSEMQVGDNVLVNGVCLTVQGVDGGVVEFSLWPQTFQKSNLKDLKAGDRVNLERNREKQ